MFKNFIGKKVEVTVVFSAGWRDGGSAPVVYIGTMESSDEKITILKLNSKTISIFGLLGNKASNENGQLVINNNFIAAIKILD